MKGCASVKLNDHMAVGASQVLAWLAVSGNPPNDEIHVMIMYHFCQFLPTHSVTVAHAQTVQAFNHI